LINKTTFFTTVLAAVIITLTFFLSNPKNFIDNPGSGDLGAIRKRGKLVALTDYNSTDYFIYRGEPMGFNYELLKSFSKHLGVDLEVITENNNEKSFGMLRSGAADIIAAGIPVKAKGMPDVLFSEPVDETRQVLVRRKNHSNGLIKSGSREMNKIRDRLGLGKNTIYVQAGFQNPEQIASLASSMGDTINISDAPYDQDKLIHYVADGIIDYTVCDENIALVNSAFYQNINISTPASPLQKIAWGVRKENSDSLLYELNSWIRDFRKTPAYALLYAKYFRNARTGIIIKSDFYANNTGKISPYDDIIRKYSARINWDWRLLASLICQESRFDPAVESGRGAYGLMQIMPETAQAMGIDITTSPEENIRAGIKYINRLHSIFDKKVSDPEERIRFILAAYNAGPGHVLDAMKLAAKNGMDPQKWEGNVEVWMLKKSKPEYYNDSVVKSGYFKGVESVNFVSEVMNRYEHYRNMVPEI
jgi:membrane-bound lytic murein transglycosylase F